MIVAWGWRTGFSVERLPSYAPMMLVAVNLLLFVFIYGRQGRQSEATIEGTDIDGFNFCNSVLGKVPLFHHTNALFQHRIALSLEHCSYPAGTVVVRQGDEGHQMFFVIDGELEVRRSDNEPVRVIDKGGFFVERSLLLEEPGVPPFKP